MCVDYFCWHLVTRFPAVKRLGETWLLYSCTDYLFIECTLAAIIRFSVVSSGVLFRKLGYTCSSVKSAKYYVHNGMNCVLADYEAFFFWHLKQTILTFCLTVQSRKLCGFFLSNCWLFWVYLTIEIIPGLLCYKKEANLTVVTQKVKFLKWGMQIECGAISRFS